MTTLARALIAAWLALLAELSVVAIAHRAELTSGWELRTGALWLAPSALLLAAPFGILAGGLATALSGGGRGARGVIATAAGAFVAAAVGLATTGRHFAAAGARIGATTLVAAVATALAWAIAPWLSSFRRTRPGWFAAALGATALGAELANRFVLVRLYPPLHGSLAAATLMLAGIAGVSAVGAGGERRRGSLLAALAILVTCSALARPAAERLSRFDNFRLLLLDRAPLLGQAVRLAALLSPPPPMGPVDSGLVDPGHSGPSPTPARGPSFAGRDIVLVTIDALRADHVGAYAYARPTTPHIDELARQAVVFEHAYCATPHTSYSVTSMMTGKYMRPLLLQGTGQDSDTLATFLRTYGYKTAAFYPPAVFFIDQGRFTPFERSHFGFEYRKVEFLEGEGRVEQVESYLGRLGADQRVFLWVHLFGPHEPYETHPGHAFGDRDIDRYDSEIAAADETVGGIVAAVRSRRPNAVIIVTADHGEEFGEHGGRYHGTTVYEEQVRVPLVVSAPELLQPRRVREVVQTIDILPTLLAGLSIPASPRIRGRNLGPLLAGDGDHDGFAFAETDESALLAEGPLRLVCARKLGACRLYDVEHDAAEQEDLAGQKPEQLERMRTELAGLGASHGKFERDGLRAETGKGWPAPILRGIAGDAEAAPDLAGLLDDSDREIRRKAAELLMKLRRPDALPALRLALGRDEDPIVRRWCALALTRMGETAPLVTELLEDPDATWRRLAALVLAESGDARGEHLLIDWWQHGARDDHDRALELLGAFARIRSKDAVWPLVQTLGNVRLRPRIAGTLATIGDSAARGPLAAALSDERYQTARVAIADALAALGAKEELARPLIRFLGVPDALPGGVGYAQRAKILDLIGGPNDKRLAALVSQSNLGVTVTVVVPRGGNGEGVRAVVRATASGRSGEVRIGRPAPGLVQFTKESDSNNRKVPRIHDRDYVSIRIPEGTTTEAYATLPDSVGARPGRAIELVVFAEANVKLEGLALVPLADELPPPPPEPWTASEGDDTR